MMTRRKTGNDKTTGKGKGKGKRKEAGTPAVARGGAGPLSSGSTISDPPAHVNLNFLECLRSLTGAVAWCDDALADHAADVARRLPPKYRKRFNRVNALRNGKPILPAELDGIPEKDLGGPHVNHADLNYIHFYLLGAKKGETRRLQEDEIHLVADALTNTDGDPEDRAAYAIKRLSEIEGLEQRGSVLAIPKPRSLAEIKALGIERIPYLIEKIAPVGEACGWYGDTSSAKTYLAFELARAVALGEPFLGTFEILKAGPVLFLDRETGSRRACVRACKLNLPDDLPIHFLTDRDLAGCFVNSPDFVPRIGEVIRKMDPPPVLAVLDSFARFFTGEENAAKDVAAAFDNLNALAWDFQMSIPVVHHTRKASKKDNSESKVKVRGSGDFVAAVSSALFFSKDGRGPIKVEQIKARDALPFEPLGVVLEASPFILDGLSFRLTDAPPAEPNKAEQAAAEIPGFLERRGGAATKAEICKAYASIGGRATIQRAIDALESAGVVKTDEGAQPKGQSPVVFITSVAEI